MSKKRILIIGINSRPEFTGIGRYTGEMLTWLAGQGHEVTMVTAYPYYPYWKIQKPYSGWLYKKETPMPGLTLYRCPLYVPSVPTGLKRMIHEGTFFMSAFLVVVKLLFKRRYDTVFTIAPPFHLGFLALFYRFFKGSPIVYHLQDLQIDAAKELGILKSGPLFSVLFNLEKFILKKADIVTTISIGMHERILNKIRRPVVLFPNWVDTNLYHPVRERDNLKRRWGFLPEDKLVVYAGSIGEKQGLDMLLHIAATLGTHKQIKFIICGTGPFKEKLAALAIELGLNNVFFFPLQGDDVFNDFLNIADVHLVLQKGDAGDLVMPSKLTTILSIGGLAIATANPGTTLYEVITANQMGIIVSPDNELELSNAIVDCFEYDHSQKRINARNFAEHNLNKDVILNKLSTYL
ncbi:WcaI family glycosyltransferase [Pedobacter ginsengisoli]|uniref:WcaI family glycosyltransferase n=1 Tax=Pedobacter ginsengisoli TaxID=363852 RepID=UPI00254DDB01|nr:WcaI family glycosyltransferase [Pedobacter ginsengisoli]